MASDVAIIATLSSVVNDLEQREWGTSRGAVASSLETVLIQQQAQWEPVAEYTRSDFCCWTPHGPTHRLMLSKSRKTEDLQTEAALRGLRYSCSPLLDGNFVAQRSVLTLRFFETG